MVDSMIYIYMAMGAMGNITAMADVGFNEK
jgi:hypothetical protein